MERERKVDWKWVLVGLVLIVVGVVIGRLVIPAPTPAVAVATPTPTPDLLTALVTQVAELSEEVKAEEATPTPVPLTATPEPTATLEPTAVPATAVCPPAEQLGPWAPGAFGEGETFEITAARGWVHASLWWPSGKTPSGTDIPWGNKEVSVLLPKGTSIEVRNGAGTAWDYPAECSDAEVARQRNAYLGDRPRYTPNWYGAIELQQLLDLGVVVRR